MYVSPSKGVRPFARLNLSLSLSLVSRILSIAHSHIYYLRAHLALLYVARLNDTKVTHDIYAVFFFLSFVSSRTFSFTHSLSLCLSRAHSYSRSFSLSNTGRVLSDKNSSLNKHMIQKLLSYRLTASVKRIVYFFFIYHILPSYPRSLFFLLSPHPPLSVSPFLSLFKYLKKLALENRNPRRIEDCGRWNRNEIG